MTLQTREFYRKRNSSEKGSSWTLIPKGATEDAPYEGAVKPRGSVALAKGSKPDLVAQSPARKSTQGEAAKRSVASQTSTSTTDFGAPQQWRSIQTAYRLELQHLDALGAAAAHKPQWASFPRVTTPALSHVSCARDARHFSPSLPRDLLLLLSVTNGSRKIRSTASIAGTSDAASHEQPLAEKQWRILLLLR